MSFVSVVESRHLHSLVRIRHVSAAALLSLVFGCSHDPGASKAVRSADAQDTDRPVADVLEQNWNFYFRAKVFLGPTYFGNTDSFGRNRGALHALALMSDYPTYRALATKGLIKLDDLRVQDAPPAVFANPQTRIERAATVSITPEGSKQGTFDKDANATTFTFGTYRVDKMTVNATMAACNGKYRLVEGIRRLTIAPGFDDLWADLGWPTNSESRFRAILEFDTTRVANTGQPRGWKIANASNGRYSAEDTGPVSGNYTSENVPPTIDVVAPKVCVR